MTRLSDDIYKVLAEKMSEWQNPPPIRVREPIFLYESEWEFFESRGVDMRPFAKIQPIPEVRPDDAPNSSASAPLNYSGPIKADGL